MINQAGRLNLYQRLRILRAMNPAPETLYLNRQLTSPRRLLSSPTPGLPWPLTCLQKPGFNQLGVPKFLRGQIAPIPKPEEIRVFFVAEAFGEQEQLTGAPLVGATGKLFRQQIKAATEKAGVNYDTEAYWLDNVINLRPPSNKFDEFCVTKADLDSKHYNYSQVDTGKYLSPEYLTHVDGLWERITYFKPNIVVGMGARALWALTGQRYIEKYRGSIMELHRPVPSNMHAKKYGFERYSCKGLITYHPARLFRDWSKYPIFLNDLSKAMYEANSPKIWFPDRTVHVVETKNDVVLAFQDIYKTWKENPDFAMGVDTETKGDAITVIGIAHKPNEAYVFPFYDDRKPGNLYWKNPEDGKFALRCLMEYLSNPSFIKVMQNGMYDLQYTLHAWDCPIMGFHEDTMLLHHSMEPEMAKGLGWLGSIYLNLPTWKTMRPKGTHTEKRDE